MHKKKKLASFSTKKDMYSFQRAFYRLANILFPQNLIYFEMEKG